MRRGQMMCAIGISNSNQFDLVQCVYITTCSFPNHTRRSPLYSCMHGFQTSWSLIQIFEFNFTLVMTSPSILHPHIGLLFIIVPLTFSHACMHTHYQLALSIAHMQSFSSGRSPMKAHTHTHLPLHHIGHSLSLTRACAMIDVPLCMCVYCQVFHSFPHKSINRYIQWGLTLFPTSTSINLYLSI